jgi:hypothetical protein
MNYKSWQIHLWGIISRLIFRSWNRIDKLRHRIISWLYVCSKMICKFSIIDFNNMVLCPSIRPEWKLIIMLIVACIITKINNIILSPREQFKIIKCFAICTPKGCIYSPWSAVTRRSLLIASVQSEASSSICLLLPAEYSGNLFRKGTSYQPSLINDEVIHVTLITNNSTNMEY